MDFTIWSNLLKQLLEGQSLSRTQAAELMQGWIKEAIPPELSGAILMALNFKGVCAEELTGMGEVLKSLSSVAINKSDQSQFLPLIDTCGTGGDGASTFNISTAVAFVVAAAGVRVAKHGSRSASSLTGSADVLEALGVNLTATSEKVQAAVEEVGITFLFAPGWHPALKAVAPLRRNLKVRTVFNLLGPLVNPLNPTGQVIGVFDPKLIATMAEALHLLGTQTAIVLHGREKLDEAGLGDITDLAILKDGQVSLTTVNPQEINVKAADITAVKGGNAQENAVILKEVLQGKGTQPQQDIVALNAALALQVAGVVPWLNHAQGVTLAKEILQSGSPWTKLEQLIQFLGD
ncbi:anthranilate phosphoribosyltransferase [Dolichospermum circinale]|uniref:Anthranilate phosphoribosyltransferase n=1 Tax=Dolichospermum circinale CS-537/01 TaxID=3021739 RepID=A0ABT5A0D3_9CYAN|nr:anthranilate phosphoribosyltransferase [Dolichospermum circinale]MDB9452779.1 anthranilate phosphoribosyltransferase [Dolichospermum circinale CS-541/06]MDB9462292.1 anthranilate phosphoribosyltransferase [Dolichospermum circinale CS-541/04]MDB9467188.1 anthranilate phosphoribosyltransferase [Dolichospermum circinale CS-539/09]MDB9471548.1 anthranilate phosphoribosyltransferase [Dolichospermum circinale CS-539]MDB9485198.1 anthranilate phosphoribosyltransferase [Dolichospermum circinale CS-